MVHELIIVRPLLATNSSAGRAIVIIPAEMYTTHLTSPLEVAGVHGAESITVTCSVAVERDLRALDEPFQVLSYHPSAGGRGRAVGFKLGGQV